MTKLALQHRDRKTRMRYGERHATCSECGKQFAAYRSDVKTCGQTCRKRRQRRLAKE